MNNLLIVTGGDFGPTDGTILYQMKEYVVVCMKRRYPVLRLFNTQAMCATDTGTITVLMEIGALAATDPVCKDMVAYCHSLLADRQLPSKAAIASGRIAVGKCQACGRELRVKASGIQKQMKLTCKCGVINTVTPSDESLSLFPTPADDLPE